MTLLNGSNQIGLVVNNLLMLPKRFPYVQILHVVFLKGQYLDLCCFLIYVNDISGVIGNKLLLYADDSTISVADKDISTVQNSLQTDLMIVSEWLIDNKLSLHLGKTEPILFGS